ncbi:glycosyltransferase [Flavobacterium sp. NST-5]|uniref:Glycosyltransferase n=1 Tax=Flavobacterium ichthyis TaxID=2698827 RepID=A0ABW9ZB23_9FLAO|nr:glycosyltransferase [Flavobacterium ichthyis]NBL64275.1 glycosyltransferase [Flavobacterium ichthyis]
MYFSFIIPVYNRPDEIDELLQSLTTQTYTKSFEIVVVEDGSTIPCKNVIQKYSQLNISYYYKKNSGPGDSRNFGMSVAKGQYFLILDSDCILPENYLAEAEIALEKNYVDCFGGPDKALESFSDLQKAINFTMTSILTTGGIRGGSEKIGKFQPRSFNMGLSKKAFLESGGFGNIHPGEDPDLSIRLWEMGFETKLFPEVFVYHKRRIDWKKFQMQVNKFGKARPILNSWYPKYSKLTFFFPSLFILGFAFSIILAIFELYFFLGCYLAYFLVLWASAVLQTNLKIGTFAIQAAVIQFYGYGTGFLKSFYKINLRKQKPQEAFPELFFKK